MPPPSSSSSSKPVPPHLLPTRQDHEETSQMTNPRAHSVQRLHTATRKGTVLPREKKKIPLFWSPSWLVPMSNCSVLSWVFKMNYYYYSPRKFTCSGWVVWSLGITHGPTGHALQINCTHSDYAASFSLSCALTSPAIFPHPAYLTEWWARLNKSHHHYPQWLLLLWLAMDDDIHGGCCWCDELLPVYLVLIGQMQIFLAQWR